MTLFYKEWINMTVIDHLGHHPIVGLAICITNGVIVMVAEFIKVPIDILQDVQMLAASLTIIVATLTILSYCNRGYIKYVKKKK